MCLYVKGKERDTYKKVCIALNNNSYFSFAVLLLSPFICHRLCLFLFLEDVGVENSQFHFKKERKRKIKPFFFYKSFSFSLQEKWSL